MYGLGCSLRIHSRDRLGFHARVCVGPPPKPGRLLQREQVCANGQGLPLLRRPVPLEYEPVVGGFVGYAHYGPHPVGEEGGVVCRLQFALGSLLSQLKGVGALQYLEVTEPAHVVFADVNQQTDLDGRDGRGRSDLRAEQLEEPIGREVKRVLQNPDLIVRRYRRPRFSGWRRKEEEIAQAERDLRSIQMEEDRAIRLFVSGKITEAQLDLQRKFITERLESARAKLDDYLVQETSEAEKRRLMEEVLT